jgi:hypothetical protein
MMTKLRELPDRENGSSRQSRLSTRRGSWGFALAGILAIFDEFKQEVFRKGMRGRIAQVRNLDHPHDPLETASLEAEGVRWLTGNCVRHSMIAWRLGIVGVSFSSGSAAD